MVSLVVRKSLKAMLGYFGDNFDSMMWVAEAGERIAHPRIGGLIPGSKAVEPWSTLSPEEFVALARAVDDRRRQGGVLAIELGFAPPKSVSIAALADLRVSREIIAMHRSAVEDALSFMSPLLVAREKKRLTECGVRLMEFLHPWNRATEPQLHSHVLVLRDARYSHALWTTPLFLLQRTLRELYHYSLCARLLAGDYRVLLGEKGSLAWELQGVPSEIVERFLERSKSLKAMALANPKGYFSQGAEFRVAGLASRRQLPKTDASVSLGELRAKWRRNLPQFSLLGHSPRVETVEVDLQKVFRMSSILTREQFIGVHVRWWLGAGAPFPEAVLAADRLLRTHVKTNSLLHVGKGYCFPKSFKTEDALINEISSGFDGDQPLYHIKPESLRPLDGDILSRPHSIKVVSSFGEPVLDVRRLRTASRKPFKGQVLQLRYWNSAEVLEKIMTGQRKPLLIIVEEPFSVGDFGQRLIRLQLAGRPTTPEPKKTMKILGRSTIVTAGSTSNPQTIFSLLKKILGSDRGQTEKEFLDWEVNLLPHASPEELHEMNWSRLLQESKLDGTELELFRTVPWGRIFRGEWKKLGIFPSETTELPVPRNSSKLLRTIRKGWVWRFTGPPADGVIPVKKEVEKILQLDALQAILADGKQKISLIEPVRVKLRPGTPLLAPIRFESNRQVFHAGEVQFFDHVDREGKVWFRGGLFWPHANLVMEPAFYVQRLPKQQKSLPVLVVHHESSGDRIKWFSGLPPAEITIIRSDEPKEFCKDFALDLRQVAAAKKQSAVARIVNGEWMMDVDGLFEPPGIWRKMIHTLSPHSREVRKPTATEKPVGETSHCKAPPKPSHSVSLNPTISVQLPSKEAVTPNEREIEELRKAAGESSQQRRPKRILTETPERNSATEQDIN